MNPIMHPVVIHNLASKSKRAFYFIVDWILISLLAVPIVMLLVMIEPTIVTNNNDLVLGVILYCSYYIICESLWCKTFGKLITKTKVVTYEGQKPSFANIVGRNLFLLIPFDPLIFFGKTGLHDSLSRTTVVNF